MKKIVDGNTACSKIAYYFSEVCSIYPITPSSPMAASIDTLTGTNLLNIFNSKPKVVEMESEAGAAGAMHGALLSGSLASTFTASQGLLLMIPNMYKMAGELLPGVIHVASRSLATHALSIFGDHQDIYATRATGFCILASSSVEDAQNLAAVAHLSAIKGSLPFLHFFDGFRTSHEYNTIEEIPEDKLLALVDHEAIKKIRNRTLNVGKKYQYGMSQTEDIYFQCTEARNKYYEAMPDIVNSYMAKINAIMDTDYKPFVYYGSEDAENIIVAMGSVCDTIKEVVDTLGNVGVIEVHLYRPFSSKYFLDCLPKSVKKIAVLDRTKESGSIGEPLFLDVCSVLKDYDIKIYGGRYGLSSKNTTPADICAVFQMLKENPRTNFTIGINDDVTNLSLEPVPIAIPKKHNEILIYGFGSDGMVSASKDLLKIVHENTDKYVQGYFEYDSKKSGGVTVSHLRYSDEVIKEPYYVTNPRITIVTKDIYFRMFDIVSNISEKGILLINTIKNKDELLKLLPNKVKNILYKKNIKVYFINADDIALKNHIAGKISKIMELLILKLLDIENALDYLEESVKKSFMTKGEDIVSNNIKAMHESLDKLEELSITNTYPETLNIVDDASVISMMTHRLGNKIPVSMLADYAYGRFPGATTRLEKRNISNVIPEWHKENCIQCGMCSLVCPHAVIRSVSSTDSSKGIPFIGEDGLNYVIEISEEDCTGCGLCAGICPGKMGNKALTMIEKKVKEKNELTTSVKNPLNKFTIKGSQLNKPLFEFSGACAGCGETAYIKLLTQLFGEKLVIANATGCSSIYGGSAPSTPYSIPWANSLFEDNAEFAFGIYTSYKEKRDRIAAIMMSTIDTVDQEEANLFQLWLDNREDFAITGDIKEKLHDKTIPKELTDLIDYIPARSVWAIGGDGWAYDIGYGGLDHVLHSNENIKVLVLDTEVYSNTGGQASKSTKLGAVAEFANFGKRTNKKDLFRIASCIPNCYVASICLGANMMQAINAFKEAEEHDGPAIIIAYSPCIEHGIKTGMGTSINEEKLAVDCGYTLLMRYDGQTHLDSKEPDFTKYEEFLNNEVRFNALKIKNPKLAAEILAEQKENAIKRYNYYKNIVS